MSKVTEGVAPLAGAWIEIQNLDLKTFQSLSLPSRERGLKYSDYLLILSHVLVAPLAGAWIEMSQLMSSGFKTSVAPLAGAWIEIGFNGSGTKFR